MLPFIFIGSSGGECVTATDLMDPPVLENGKKVGCICSTDNHEIDIDNFSSFGKSQNKNFVIYSFLSCEKLKTAYFNLAWLDFSILGLGIFLYFLSKRTRLKKYYLTSQNLFVIESKNWI